MTGQELLSAAIAVGHAGLAVALGLAALRLLRGPTDADRVVALDLVAFLTVAATGLLAIDRGEVAFLDVGLGLSVVAFLGTLWLSRLVVRPGGRAPARGRGPREVDGG